MIKKTHEAMYGYRFSIDSNPGLNNAWFSSLFNEYSLFPYLELGHPEVNNILFKKTLFSKLVPVFSKRLKITSILNEAIGKNLFSEKKVGIIEEIADVILNEIESRETILSRVQKNKKNISALYGVSTPMWELRELPVVEGNINTLNGKLASIEGHLIHISALDGVNQALFESLSNTDVEWLISDYPFFQMVSDNKKYKGGVVGIRFSSELSSLIGDNVPFDGSCGWFPYVKVFGVFHGSHSAQHPSLRVIDYCWMYFRSPKSFDSLHTVIGDFFEREDSKYFNEVRTEQELLLMLSAIQLSYRTGSLGYGNAREDVKKLVDRAMDKLPEKIIPNTIFDYFTDKRPNKSN